jgi:hypothetical protein
MDNPTADVSRHCDNPWHRTAPSRAAQICPECPAWVTAEQAARDWAMAYVGRIEGAEFSILPTGDAGRTVVARVDLPTGQSIHATFATILGTPPPATVTADEAGAIVAAGGQVRRDDRFGGEYRYIVERDASTSRPDNDPPIAGAFLRPDEAGPNDCTCWATSRNGCPKHYVR